MSKNFLTYVYERGATFRFEKIGDQLYVTSCKCYQPHYEMLLRMYKRPHAVIKSLGVAVCDAKHASGLATTYQWHPGQALFEYLAAGNHFVTYKPSAKRKPTYPVKLEQIWLHLDQYTAADKAAKRFAKTVTATLRQTTAQAILDNVQKL